MQLYIDTSSSEKVVIKFDGKTYKEELGRSQELLSLIDAALRKSHKTIKDITEVRFNRGPGSFTGLRVGASVANTFGWVLDMPVNGRKGVVEPLY